MRGVSVGERGVKPSLSPVPLVKLKKKYLNLGKIYLPLYIPLLKGDNKRGSGTVILLVITVPTDTTLGVRLLKLI